MLLCTATCRSVAFSESIPKIGRVFFRTLESNPLSLIIGSGVTDTNVKEHYGYADALIGLHFKDFDLMDDVDRSCVAEFMEKYKKLD